MHLICTAHFHPPQVVYIDRPIQFNRYTLDDIERITENGKVVYRIELNSLTHQDWEVILDGDGKVLSKKVD